MTYAIWGGGYCSNYLEEHLCFSSLPPRVPSNSPLLKPIRTRREENFLVMEVISHRMGSTSHSFVPTLIACISVRLSASMTTFPKFKFSVRMLASLKAIASSISMMRL
ncbi:uncharacterized protein DS421_2g59000 [Arachis hypogaea]|nr:uncharacterized protein DS421_2g59000 [Arachis hypogaea]